MKASTLGLVLAGCCIVAACLVDRVSKDFECETQADCSDGRNCVSNYCVVPNCPDGCSPCDESAKTCTKTCDQGDDCDDVDCPSGWTCTVVCNGDGACNDVTCHGGSKCNISCNGSNACSDIDCQDACKCDLQCASGACDSKMCPSFGNGGNRVECTSDGTTSTQCDSAHAAGCTKC